MTLILLYFLFFFFTFFQLYLIFYIPILFILVSVCKLRYQAKTVFYQSAAFI